MTPDAAKNPVEQLPPDEQRQLLRTVIDEDPNIILVKDWEGRFLMANRALAQLYGTTPDEMVGRDDGHWNPNAEQVAFYRRNVQEVMRRGQTEVVYEQSTDVSTGRTRYFQSIKKPLLGTTGQHDRILVIANDITEIREAQLQVEESERRLRYVMEATQEGVWDWHLPSGKLSHNAPWHQMLGYQEHELTGSVQDFMACLHPEDREQVMNTVTQAMKTGVRYVSEHRLLRRDGSVIWVLDRGAVVERDEQGNPVRMVGSFSDITARRAMEDELRQATEQAQAASRAKSAFLANMSHEVRTPLNGLLGMLELTLGTDLSAAQREYLQVAKESGERLLGLLSAVLDLARLDQGELVLVSEPIEPEAKLRRVLGPFIAEAAARGLRVLLEIGPGVPECVQGDRLRLRQVLDCLVSNAFKFTATGEVSLSVFRRDNPMGQPGLEFQVRDTGIGISPQDQQRLFQPFAPLDQSETRRHGGVGLGLYLAQQLVRLMGGSIRLESASGQGTVASVWIPLREVAGSALLPVSRTELVIPPARMARPPVRHARVLVVDDHPVNRMLATRILEEAGFSVVQAEDGVQALQAIQEHRPDAVLMDCHMPVMDGVAATRAWREREQREGLAGIPIMALTAHAAPTERARCLEAGMNDFMGKPYTARELIDMVERNLGAGTAGVKSDELAAVESSAHQPSASELCNIERGILDGLRDALGDDLGQIMSLFLSQLDEQLGAIKLAVQSRDATTLAAQAHSLKGSSGNLGLMGISGLAASLEQVGRRQAFDGADQALESLLQVAEATRQTLSEMGYTAS